MRIRRKHIAQTNNGTARQGRTIEFSIVRKRNSVHSQPGLLETSASASELIRLLDADTVDLASLGDAIRCHPDLESMVFKVCQSMGLFVENPEHSIEGAAILLGKHELKCLIRAWRMIQSTADESGEAKPVGPPIGEYGIKINAKAGACFEIYADSGDRAIWMISRISS